MAVVKLQDLAVGAAVVSGGRWRCSTGSGAVLDKVAQHLEVALDDPDRDRVAGHFAEDRGVHADLRRALHTSIHC